MAKEVEQRRKIIVDQHAAASARGQAAAQQDRLHSRAQQTQAQLVAAQHAHRAQQIKALNADAPAPLSRRYEAAAHACPTLVHARRVLCTILATHLDHCWALCAFDHNLQ